MTTTSLALDTSFLAELGIQEHNLGVSTGQQWIDGDGELIASYSPVDGTIIGYVKAAI